MSKSLQGPRSAHGQHIMELHGTFRRRQDSAGVSSSLLLAVGHTYRARFTLLSVHLLESTVRPYTNTTWTQRRELKDIFAVSRCPFLLDFAWLSSLDILDPCRATSGDFFATKCGPS